MYNAAIGRFNGVDLLADAMPGISPYSYSYNNPIMFNDPSGLSPNRPSYLTSVFDTSGDSDGDGFVTPSEQWLYDNFTSTDPAKENQSGNNTLLTDSEGNRIRQSDIGGQFALQEYGTLVYAKGVPVYKTVQGYYIVPVQSGGDQNVPGGKWDIWGVGSVDYLGDAIGGTNFIGPGLEVNPYDLGLIPVDEIDAGALSHDYAYWQNGVGGVAGAYNSTSVRFADADLVYTSVSIMERYQRGGIDKITNQPISQRTYNLAKAVYLFFSPIVVEKFRREGVIYPLIIPRK